MSVPNKKLDSNITLEGEPLGALVGDDVEEYEVLGYGVVTTIGDAVIPRDWLMQRADELDIPEWLLPGEPRPSSAYKRAVNRLVSAVGDKYWIDGREVTLQLRNPERAGPNVRHVLASIHYPQEETGDEGGRYEHYQLGMLDYNHDTQRFVAVRRLEADAPYLDELNSLWSNVVEEMASLFEEMQECNLGEDIRDKTLYRMRKRHTSTVISLRDGGGLYFFPVQFSDLLESMSTLLTEIDVHYKEGGRRMSLRTMPIFDSEADWIEERVEMELQQRVDNVLDSAFDDFDEGQAASEVVRTVVGDLDEAFDTAEQYNSLLEAELNVEEYLEQLKADIAEQSKQDIIERVLQNQP